jgi:hypothetical protein
MVRNRSLRPFLVLLLGAGLACVYYSKPFEPPVSTDQQKLFAAARRDVFPDQVRQDPDAYADTLVAWAGIVEDARLVPMGSDTALIISVAHHYFDWIEDHGAQAELFFLSSRGEGVFFIAKSVPQDSLEYWKAEAPQHVGKMLVAVGEPENQLKTSGSTEIPFADQFYVMFHEGAFHTDWDYGRHGPGAGAPGESR